MLDCTAPNLRTEVEAAIALRQKHITIGNELIGRYATGWYRDDWTPDMPSHENHEFEFVVNILPAVLASNPAVSVKSRRPVVQRELTEAMQHGLNRWVHDVDLRGKFEAVVYDAAFKFGVMLVTMEPVPGHEHKEVPPLRPALKRISPRMFFIDPQANGPDDARFMGHVFLRDRDDLLNAKNPDGSDKFIKSKVEQLAADAETADIISDVFIEDMEIRVPRNQVVGAEIFVKEKGMIYTLGFASIKDKEKRTADFIRKPRKFFGHPKNGPYVPVGFYLVPDQVYPLSPLCVTAEAVQEANAHSEQITRQASRARNILLVDGTNAGMIEAVKNYDDGTIASIPNFDRNAFAEVNLGGPDLGQIDYLERLRQRIDRRSGLTDIQRGQISGDATATEAQLAAAASSGRVRFMQQQIRRAVQRVLENAAWLMFNSESVVFPVSEERAEKLVFEMTDLGPQMRVHGGEPEADRTFYGGIQPGQENFNFFDLELEIDPYSMEQVDEAVLQKRMEMATATVASFAPMMLQYPFVNWPELLDDYFQALNIPDGRKYINFEALSQMMQVQFSAGQPRGIPGIDGAPPVDTSGFKGPPNMPTGKAAKDIVRSDQSEGGPGGASPQVREIASLLGAGSAA